MVLSYRCNNCKKSIILSFRASDRVEIRKDHSAELDGWVCRKCNTPNSIKVNDIRSIENKKANSIAMVISLFLSLGLAYFVIDRYWTDDIGINLDVVILIGGAVALPQIIVGTVIQSNRKAVKTFNKHYV